MDTHGQEQEREIIGYNRIVNGTEIYKRSQYKEKLAMYNSFTVTWCERKR